MVKAALEVDQATTDGAPKALGQVSQFGLLRTRRLGPLFTTQFLGAFNDNVFKQALFLILTFGGLLATEAGGVLVNLAAGLFVAPFLLFSATAGTLADKFEKSRLIRFVKLAEIGVATLAGAALYLQSVPALLAVLFLLGTQSAFFGPLKYAILPQHLDAEELVGGNAMVQMGTLAAILLGTMIGGVIGAGGEVTRWLFVLLVAIAAVGYAASRYVPEAPSTERGDIDWNPIRQTWALVTLARERKAVYLSILGISWFWLLGAVYLAQIPELVVGHLAGGPSVVTLILIFFTISIATGALLCERLSRRRVEIGLVPLGAAGVSIFGADVYFAIAGIQGEGARTAWEFLIGEGTPRLLVDLGLMGICTGLFVVPLQANVQARTPTDRRARVISANNVLNALFMVGGAGFAIAWLTYGGTVRSLLLVLALVNAAVALFIFQQVPEFTMRFLIWLLSHTMYRVRHEGLDNVPDRGGAIIVCNHVSYVDAPLLAGAVRRPIRFVMDRDIYNIPVLNFIFRTGRAIPITAQKDDPAVYDAALAAIREGLVAGDLLAIFPEGRLTGDGEIGTFRRGIERIVKATPVPVVPMALRGLWGSFFSREGRGAFRPPRDRRRRTLFGGRLRGGVDIAALAPVAPDQVTADDLREQVLTLRGDDR